MNELHPSPSARTGTIPDGSVNRGVHADQGAFNASKEVWCKQCGFRCNLDRDARGINEFAGETITSGNELTSGSFEDWTAGSPDDWTLSGSVTETTTSGYFNWLDAGTSSCQIVRNGSDISLSQAMSTPSDFNSNTIRFGVRVKSSTTGIIRLQVVINSTTYSSAYNTAQQAFQDLVMHPIIAPATVSSLTVYILADSSDGTAYVDSAMLMRSGNPTTAAVTSACPHCGSFDYF